MELEQVNTPPGYVPIKGDSVFYTHGFSIALKKGNNNGLSCINVIANSLIGNSIPMGIYMYRNFVNAATANNTFEKIRNASKSELANILRDFFVGEVSIMGSAIRDEKDGINDPIYPN
jgi:hypothetical protein